MIVDCSLFKENEAMATPNMQERHLLVGAFNFSTVEVEIREPPGNGRLMGTLWRRWLHNKKVVNAKQILLDSMNDHLIPHFAKKKTAKDMYDALGTFY
jgi:hypothetical protein